MEPLASRSAWRVLRRGAGYGLLLVIDPGPSSGSSGDVREFTRRLPGSTDIWQACSPSGLGAREPRAETYLGWWASGLALRRQPPIIAILGFGAGALFATESANLVHHQLGARPAVILFYPERPRIGTLVDALHRSLDTMPGIGA